MPADVFLGQSGVQAYTNLILWHSSIKEIELYEFDDAGTAQVRSAWGDAEEPVLDGVRTIKKDYDIPFWDAVFLHILHNGGQTDRILDGALFHKGPGKNVVTLDRKHIAQRGIELLVRQVAERNISLSSRVVTVDDQLRHLPILDFCCAPSVYRLELVNGICSRLMPEGYVVLNSGASYHACGFGLLSPTDRVDWLARALRFGPVTDRAYIAHQLQQEFSTIRLSKGGGANKEPIVVSVRIKKDPE